MLNNLKADLQKIKNPVKAKLLSGFFKTEKGEYGEGDIFLGLTVPQQREIVKKYFDLTLDDLQEMLSSKIHEYRFSALAILVEKFKKTLEKGKSAKGRSSYGRKEIFDFYIKNTKNINNWDLVDLSAANIIGNYLMDKDKSLLYKLAQSDNLWKKRIAIISTFQFIKNNQFEDTLKISEILLNDKHDLIHKAVGWMLREIGKKNQTEEEKFLNKYCKKMPRTMLRYAIEKFPKNKKNFYLKK
ncbi:MAG: DNA alkylation repair protein [Candidatus Roizmanbacteria bacterium]|nr:MAG: DNA alkylation repair protein [Candidatus Roizmanbacteria bacterium]